jgi:uncharacterized YigZ family protein
MHWLTLPVLNYGGFYNIVLSLQKNYSCIICMSLHNVIKTLKEPSENIYKEKGSEFFARGFPVKSEQEVTALLNETKKLFHDASHHCYAFRLKNDSFRYSDAGEPAGTAGIRILNAIDRSGFKDVLVIVTRYFGGIKLGVGPLGRAYYISTELLLRNCTYLEEKPFNKVTLECDFNLISSVHRILSNNSAVIRNINYGENIIFETLMPLEYAESIKKELINASSGNIKILTNPEIVYHSI